MVPGGPRGAQERPTWWRRHRGRLDDLLVSAVVVSGAGTVVVGDLATGVAAVTWWRVALTLALAVGLWWRRRHPLLLACAACAGVVLGASVLVLPVAVLTLAVRRRDLVLVPVAVAAETALMTDIWRAGLPDGVAAVAVSAVLSGGMFIGLPLAVGAYLGARRDLVESLRERALRAETEQLLRAEQTRLAERTRIAREMHDVLGHRISLVALHAGGLEVNAGAGAEDVERAAALIGTTARQALDDLRAVLGVLRAGGAATGSDGGPGGLLPPPTLRDVDRLVRASTDAGVTVRLHDDIARGTEPPPLLGRTAYRVVQEGLTNVHKHAPGASATVRLSGGPGEVLEVEISNASAVGATSAPPLPGTGSGLVGLRERVELAGGALHAARRDGGGFSVRARLPWPDGPGVTR